MTDRPYSNFQDRPADGPKVTRSAYDDLVTAWVSLKVHGLGSDTADELWAKIKAALDEARTAGFDDAMNQLDLIR